MLTIGGAKAVGLEDRIGSVEVGKLADLVLIDFDAANLVPVYDYYSHLIYAISAANVTDVMINGQMLMKDRNMLHIDEAEIKSKVKHIAERVKRV
jgi:5-methylthioadenosine/S-adenosylhomocysteine deaminase